MDFSEPGPRPDARAERDYLEESVKGENSVMPAPVHRFRPLIDAGESGDRDGMTN